MKKVLISIAAIALVILLAALIIYNSKVYPLKNTEKYANYITYAMENRNKELIKNKINIDENNYLYSNVIYEIETPKKNLNTMDDNDIVAEYLVCLVNKVDDLCEDKYYICKIPYVKYKNKVNDELAQIKDLDIGGVLTSGIDGAGKGASAMGTYGALAGTGVVPGAGTAIVGTAGLIGGAIGGFVLGAGGNLFEQFESGKAKLQEFINLLPDESYKQSLIDFSYSIDPVVKTVQVEELSYYLNDNDLKLLNKTISRYH